MSSSTNEIGAGEIPSLFTQTREYMRWHAAVAVALWRSIPGPFALSIALLSIARFCQVLAMFLPLKVLLLVASDGVSRYFRFFITEETRDAWIIGLSIAAFLSYAASIALVTVSNRRIERGARMLSADAEAGAAEKGGNRNRHRRRRSELRSFIDSCSDEAIITLGGMVIFLLDPVIGMALAVVVAIEMALIDRLLKISGGWLTFVKTRIMDRYKQIITYLSALNFLNVFVLLLIDFLFFGGQNILSAILILLMSRQVFGAAQGFANKGVKFNANREQIANLFLLQRNEEADSQGRGTDSARQ